MVGQRILFAARVKTPLKALAEQVDDFGGTIVPEKGIRVVGVFWSRVDFKEGRHGSGIFRCEPKRLFKQGPAFTEVR